MRKRVASARRVVCLASPMFRGINVTSADSRRLASDFMSKAWIRPVVSGIFFRSHRQACADLDVIPIVVVRAWPSIHIIVVSRRMARSSRERVSVSRFASGPTAFSSWLAELNHGPDPIGRSPASSYWHGSRDQVGPMIVGELRGGFPWAAIKARRGGRTPRATNGPLPVRRGWCLRR